MEPQRSPWSSSSSEASSTILPRKARCVDPKGTFTLCPAPLATRVAGTPALSRSDTPACRRSHGRAASVDRCAGERAAVRAARRVREQVSRDSGPRPYERGVTSRQPTGAQPNAVGGTQVHRLGGPQAGEVGEVEADEERHEVRCGGRRGEQREGLSRSDFGVTHCAASIVYGAGISSASRITAASVKWRSSTVCALRHGRGEVVRQLPRGAPCRAGHVRVERPTNVFRRCAAARQGDAESGRVLRWNFEPEDELA